MGLVFGLEGVGFLGAVDAVSGMEAGAEHFLLALSVTASHGLDDVVETGFLAFLFHCFDGLVFLVKEARIVPNGWGGRTSLWLALPGGWG